MNPHLHHRLVAILATTLFALSSRAAIIHVPEDAATVQQAIDMSRDGDVIDVAAGTWYEVLDLSGRSILIKGRTGEGDTIIDASGRNDSVVRCISGEGPGTVLEGLTLTAGSGHRGMHGPELSLGGGLLALGSKPTIRNCRFIDNTATMNGGGVYCGKGADIRFENCTFSGNAAEKGGGLLCVDSSPVLIGCTFERNRARYSGGGMYAATGSSPVLRDCTFKANNAAFQGGAVCTMQSAGELLDCEFDFNRAGMKGGAIYFGFRATMKVSACAFASPTDGIEGGREMARGDVRRGACDLGEGHCIIAEEDDCLAAAGEFRGLGSRCAKADPVKQAKRGGDLNQDGEIDRSDLAILMLLWR